ncbi:IclR family transcriptional regulator [Thalassobacillus pellis]|uniref:IclR family transcriptional regulator n=1 Tax=Thalassobacillus pellis TaxID=748008 RepID=UPI001961B49F|nr:IclR family transcriptional regulator [Thalassobacillus pellis]MBM7551607.1 DNA-binding IclR family transcriptional regulator [Thalassobacillus pellis]
MPIIQSVDRALAILNLFDEYSPELKITEISDRMHLNKSTIHSLLKTLQKHHYIEQNTENGKYRLGMKLFERGNIVIHNLDIRTTAKRHLIDLSMKTGHTINLVILDGKEGVYIDKVEGSSGTILYSRIGRRIPVHCSAVGKVLVAFKKEEELNRILESYDYIKQPPNTITNEKAFREELDQVKRQGYGYEKEENEPGVCCFAVPVKDHMNQVIAAISLSMPSARLHMEDEETIVAQLKMTGDQISAQMGHNHSSFKRF